MTVPNAMLEFFINHNRLSAARLAIFVKNEFNNHLHLVELSHIRKKLSISDRTIRKNLQQLIELGVCVEYAPGYWRFNAWRKYAGEAKRSRVTHIKLENLKNLKALRTSYYMTKYRSAYYCAKKNRISELKNDREKRHAARFKNKGFEKVSASFVKAVTGIGVETQTLVKHVNRAEKLKLVEIKKWMKVHAKSIDIADLYPHGQYLIDSDIPAYIRKFNGTYYLVTHEAHKVRFVEQFELKSSRKFAKSVAAAQLLPKIANISISSF